MSNFDPLSRFTNRCLLSLAFLAAACFSSRCQATELELTLESGSVLVADVPLGAIDWTEVQSNGQMTNRRVAVGDIRRLWLCKTPASDKVAQIRELLFLLQSDNYREREAAELELSNPDIGGQFPKMLSQLAATADAETKYRVNRILNKISDYESSTPSEFDELKLKSGRILRGDAGDFSFTCTVDGQRLSLKRNQLRMLRTPEVNPDPSFGSEPVETEIVLVPQGKFYLPEQTTIHLETDPLGNELDRKADISRTYIPLGLKLGSVERGYVGISGYGFKFPETPTGKNSGAVFMESRSGNQVLRYKKFIGTLVIDFCTPDQPSVAAGVNEFGVHIATVEYERAFVMEAFNAAGQIIANVEAGERDCAFMGVRSNELIASLQIRKNSNMDKFHRKPDDDFAFDSICFSTPKQLTAAKTRNALAVDGKASVRLKNGNVWFGNRMELDANGSIELVDADFQRPAVFGPDMLGAISFVDPKAGQRPKRRSWSMQLADGSILNVDPNSRFRSQLAPDYLVPIDQAVALWPSESPARFAHSTDWNDAKEIVVLPTGRILASGIKFTTKGYSWKTLDKRLQELSPNANELAQDENPMPDLNQVIYKEVDDSNAPTVWLRQPRTINPNAGFVLLRDGQRLMFGDGQLFQLIQLGRDSVQLKVQSRNVTIDNDRIHSVKFETRK